MAGEKRPSSSYVTGPGPSNRHRLVERGVIPDSAAIPGRGAGPSSGGGASWVPPPSHDLWGEVPRLCEVLEATHGALQAAEEEVETARTLLTAADAHVAGKFRLLWCFC